MGRDFLELIGEAPLRVPQIEGFLHAKPQTGTVAAELAQAAAAGVSASSAVNPGAIEGVFVGLGVS